jgi:hypothetical protein
MLSTSQVYTVAYEGNVFGTYSAPLKQTVVFGFKSKELALFVTKNMALMGVSNKIEFSKSACFTMHYGPMTRRKPVKRNTLQTVVNDEDEITARNRVNGISTFLVDEVRISRLENSIAMDGCFCADPFNMSREDLAAHLDELMEL